MNPSNPTTRPPIISQLLKDDPEMRDVVEEFVNGLMTRVGEFQQAYRAQEWSRLKTLAHQLKGAGGSYGYPDLSALGKVMEDSFRQETAERFDEWMGALDRLVNAAKAGLSA